MAINYEVRQGECMNSIANQHGFFPETIWGDSANAELNKKRKDGEILYPGDVVVIPEKRIGQETGATEKRHKFRRKGIPTQLRIYVKRFGEPRADEPYVVDIDGTLQNGRTGADGLVKVTVPPGAKKGRLTVGEQDDQDEYPLALGFMDPITEVSGIQKRLNNLGIICGNPTGELNEETKNAISLFQAKYELPVTGEPNDETRAKLREVHGS